MPTYALEFTQGDTLPEVVAKLKNKRTNAPIDLTDATVRFWMRKADDSSFTVDAVATVTNAPQGYVSYAWAANDLSVPGDYLIRFHVIFGAEQSNREQTSVDDPLILVRAL
jgi:hypothetical protein